MTEAETKTICIHRDIFMREHVNELANEVKKVIEAGFSNISIDFNAIENIDIIGFGVLRTVQKISITNNIKITLFNVADNVRQILKNSCLMLDIFEEEEENSIHEEIALIA